MRSGSHVRQKKTRLRPTRLPPRADEITGVSPRRRHSKQEVEMVDSKQHETKPDEARRPTDVGNEAGEGNPAGAGTGASMSYDAPGMQSAGARDPGRPGMAGEPGSMQRAEQYGAGAAQYGRGAVRGAVATTEELGTGVVGGAAHMATDLVHGVTDLGYEVRNGATGLIGAVGDIGSAVVHTAAGLLVEVVGGVRQVVAAAIGDHHDGCARQAGPMQTRDYPDQGRPVGTQRPNQESRP
jgi:hypothetical protein